VLTVFTIQSSLSTLGISPTVLGEDEGEGDCDCDCEGDCDCDCDCDGESGEESKNGDA
jgi:hypothetical protein